MDIFEKYQLERFEYCIGDKLPENTTCFLFRLKEEHSKSGKDELYVNDDGKLKLIVKDPLYIVMVLLFIKKYREYNELLPKNLRHESPRYRQSATINKAMQLMLIPMNSYREFMSVLNKANNELMPMSLQDAWGENTPEYFHNLKIRKYGTNYIFIENLGEVGLKNVNIHGDKIPVSECRHTYIYHDKKNECYEVYAYNFLWDAKEGGEKYYLETTFYDESYLYIYLLNEAIEAVKP